MVLLSLQAAEAKARLLRALPSSDARAVGLWLDAAFPYPFQQEWVLNFQPFSLFNKSRQIGGSHSSAGWCVVCGMLGETTTLISVGQREADEILLAARRHAQLLARLGARWARPAAKGYGEGESMGLVTGGRVISLPASSGGRSFSGNVFLDEFAYHGNADEKLWDAAAGSTTLGSGKIRIASTPNGVGNLFHEFATDEERHPRISRHRVTVWDAIADGYPIDPEKCLRDNAHGNKRVFAQMYECAFLDGAEQYIPTELIGAASQMPPWATKDCPTYAGLDIGRTADLTALVIVRIDAMNIAHVVHVEVLKRTSSSDVARLAATAMNVFGCRRLCVDSTGLGSFPAEDLERQYGKRIECVNFTLQSKEALATTLYQRFATSSLRLPPDNAELRDDIASLRRTVTSAGNVRYDAPQTERGHADRAWALALALHGCAKPPNTRTEIGPTAAPQQAAAAPSAGAGAHITFR